MSNVGELVEPTEYSYIVDENVIPRNYLGKRSGSSYIKLNKCLPRNPAILLLGIYLRKMKTCTPERLAQEYSLKA